MELLKLKRYMKKRRKKEHFYFTQDILLKIQENQIFGIAENIEKPCRPILMTENSLKID